MKITGKIGPIQNVKTLVALGIIHTHTHIIYPFLFIYILFMYNTYNIHIYICVYISDITGSCQRDVRE